MSRRRRLESRFALHDNEINRHLALFAMLFVLSLCLVPWTLDHFSAPEWLINSGTLGFGFLAVVGFFVWYRRLAIRIGKKHGLLCANCQRPLRKVRGGSGDPDYRIDGQVPNRCPHCHVDIRTATKK